MTTHHDLFDIRDQVAFLTGAGGVLIGGLAQALGRRGARVVVADRSPERAAAMVASIQQEGGEAMAVTADVLDADSMARALDAVRQRWGRVDMLVNGAGGNQAEATTGPNRTFFDLPPAALRQVMDLNLMGSVIPSQVVGRAMAERGEGVILNVSSMNAFRPLTRIVGYSAAKAAINNFTQWLAVHLAQTCSPRIRVNAMAPGFFLTEQNRFLLTKAEDGSLTERGQQILAHTPMARFGQPGDIVGTALWLLSPASAFVTGVVVPVDGGFSAYSGV
jgi:NAD(P)-dependent dehydrogenase (short-subunit alcohol dehydrogenase family)